MSSFPVARAALRPRTRSIAVAALLGLAAVGLHPSLAGAEIAPNSSMLLAQATKPAVAVTPTVDPTDAKAETVDQRIASLRASLKITTDQEAKWTPVAQAMRDNAAAMEKLIAEARANPPDTLNALEDLNMYRKFAQAHVDGLKNLSSTFATLYGAMPDAQKKIADGVFQSHGRPTVPARG